MVELNNAIAANLGELPELPEDDDESTYRLHDMVKDFGEAFVRAVIEVVSSKQSKVRQKM